MEEMQLLPVILQGGSFALLVVITLWMLYWIPKWWSQWNETQEAETNARIANATAHQESIKQLTTSYAAAVDRTNAAHSQTAQELIRAHKEEARYEREQCAGQHAMIMEAMREQMQLLQEHHQMTQAYIGYRVDKSKEIK